MAPSVCVIIAAKDSALTIGAAVASALRESEVARLVVVDDGSSDDTATVAAQSDDGSGRLELIRLAENRGPSFARNRALERCREDFVAILDADDRFLPGRFARLFTDADWDMAADNIAFLDENASGDLEARIAALPSCAPAGGASSFVSTQAFIEGNLSLRGRPRGELGFLKPVIRRSILPADGPVYDEAMRLGEDYDLYARLLLAGARFRIVPGCGYVAMVRGNSLSGRHSTQDLALFMEADTRLLTRSDLSAGVRAALRAHERQTRARLDLRRFLDAKKAAGLPSAAVALLREPGAWAAVAGGIARDKAAALRARLVPPPPVSPEPRFLFSTSDAAETADAPLKPGKAASW
ncbi:glycosyltransferase family 2 protein [Aureimonas mangrovi]|uniref:glycosyltransferase family 2 protein n=1 Tax=Aureimonas mangrovi TaxID=2758041 RepID=UPI001FEBAC95|nr:glycosyltransferase family 2 protein [Aureimonas mangrovi]